MTDNSILYPGNAEHEKDEDGKETGEWICAKHGNIYRQKLPNSYNNTIKAMRPCRTGDLDPNCNVAKGKMSQQLACRLYEWKDLNEEDDNYTTPLDCYGPKTGLYHQVQGRNYNSERGSWIFAGFEGEWRKIFEDMACFCISEDGNTVERIYIIPFEKEIKKKRKGIGIYKNPSRGIQLYEQYRRTDKDELKNANKIWVQILEENTKS